MGTPTRPIPGDPAWWQLPLLLALSLGYESLFIWNGLNLTDEGWPLYAAMRLHEGGRLYADVFWVFPPGALLPAWLAYALDPPGVVAARWIYAAFDVALCLALYGLGRRLMGPAFAFLGAALLAVAAPQSHIEQLLFGYRYLLFSALSLLCFSQFLREGVPRWMYLAGAFAGIALLFRLTPAFAVCAGVGMGILASTRSWRGWLREGLRFSAGLLAIVVPVVLYFGVSVGFETLWREVVVRPVLMTEFQSLPVPDLYLPERFDRWHVEYAFSTLEFWLYPLLYLGYAGWLARRWYASLRDAKPFAEVLLLATVVWGGVYFMRSFGRADIAHLESAIPPVCLLIAHLAQPRAGKLPLPGWRTVARVGGIFVAWVLVHGVDLYALPQVRGEEPLAALGNEVRAIPEVRERVDTTVRAIRQLSEAGETLLDLSASPLFHVLSRRPGVGHSDVVMPGTFLEEEEEERFLERLRAVPPALVLVPRRAFDDHPRRAVWKTAPATFEWVEAHYVLRAELREFFLLARPRVDPSSKEEASGVDAGEP